jgi:hypothetical protein
MTSWFDCGNARNLEEKMPEVAAAGPSPKKKADLRSHGFARIGISLEKTAGLNCRLPY